MKPKVNIFTVYREDNRKSMEIYSNALFDNFPENNQIEMSLYQPKKTSWNKYFTNKLSIRDRISRYVDYPVSLIPKRNNYSHIIDHTYAHLAMTLNPDRCIVTVHDLIPFLAWKGRIQNLNLSHMPLLFMYSTHFIKKVKKIIAVSHSTKNDLEQLLGIDEEKIEVIYNGVDNAFQPPLNRNIIKAESKYIRDGVFNILIIGNSDYKNNQSSLAAIELLENTHDFTIQIICLGNDPIKFARDCSKVKLRLIPRFAMGLSLEDVVKLYSSCDCLLFPSLYEGFGFPPLEAMACGLPVVSSNIGAIAEVVGDAALTTESNNIEELSHHLYTVLADADLRNDLINRGLMRAKKFTWAATSDKTLRLYKETWGI